MTSRTWILLTLFPAILGAGHTGHCADLPSPLPRDTLPARLSAVPVPLGLPERPIPKDSPLSDQRVELGRRLFFDPILSADKTVACASCHHPEHGFSTPEAKPRGIRGQQIDRRAPTLWNRAYGQAFFWDGRAASLEEQALQPIANPKEMGSSVEEAVRRLKSEKNYSNQFATAFDDGVTPGNLARALASFQRTLLRGDSRVDRFRKSGEHDGLTVAERHGMWVYESKGFCWRCHGGANFTDERLHNTGVGWGQPSADTGRQRVTNADSDRGKFKTPTLRGVALRAPYMHDGSLKTLEEVIEFYDKGGVANPHLDTAMQRLDLSPEEKKALVAFLKAL